MRLLHDRESVLRPRDGILFGGCPSSGQVGVRRRARAIRGGVGRDDSLLVIQ